MSPADETRDHPRQITVQEGSVLPGPQDREHRRQVRRPCDRWVGIVAVSADGSKSAVRTARAENISAGGLGLYAWDEFDGAAAVLIPREAGEPTLVGAEFVYCRPRSRLDFDCGLRFTEATPGVTLDDFREESGRLVDLGAPAGERSPS